MLGRTGLQGLLFPLDLRIKPEDDKSERTFKTVPNITTLKQDLHLPPTPI